VSVDRHIFRECITLYRPPLLVGASCDLARTAGSGGRAKRFVTAPVPFTLKIQETDYERNFAGDLAKVETQAQRSDGATVVVVTTYRTPVPSTFRAIRLPDGTRLRLVDAISAKSTCRPKHREVAPVRDTLSIARRPPDCLGPLDKLLGRTTLFGQLVDVVKTWDRGSGGEEWLAPALGCKEFQWQNATMQSDGSRRIDLEAKLLSFTLGEPDVRLFDLDARYTEIKPSELRRRELKAAGVHWNPELAKESVQEDERYAAACQMPGPLQQ